MVTDTAYVENVMITSCNNDYMFELRFLKENVWFEVPVDASKVEEIEYVGIYRSAPIQAITHLGRVRDYSLYGNTGKYIFHLEDVEELNNAIVWNKGDSSMRGRRYFTHDEIMNAKTFAELTKGR